MILRSQNIKVGESRIRVKKAEAFVSYMKEMVAPKQGDWIQFAIALKDTDELIGDLGCYIKEDDVRQARIGFTLASKYWRKGYITEVIPCLLEYLFEDMDVHRVVADCDAGKCRFLSHVGKTRLSQGSLFCGKLFDGRRLYE